MQAVPDEPNVTLRSSGAGDTQEVVLAFPYDGHLVAAVRTLPGRRFDWDRREWSAPADGWVAAKLATILGARPDLRRSAEFDEWLAAAERRWVGHVRTTRYDGRGWFALDTLAGEPPKALRKDALALEGRWLVPLTPAHAAAIAELRDPRLSLGARRCIESLECGEQPPAARLILTRSVAGERLTLETFWDPDAQAAFEALPGAAANELKLDAWIVDQLDAFIARHEIDVAPTAAQALEQMAAEHRAAQRAVAASRATTAEPLAEVAPRLGGELAPFQWAAVRYALQARRTFLSDEQGLGKTVEALATLEADGAFPAVVICPASMKLTWEREANHWLPHRSVAVLSGREGRPLPDAEIVILNYEIVAGRLEALVASGPRALVADESHYCKNPTAKRTRAVRRLADAVATDGLRLALTGTPVMNHADELIAQLRVIGRLAEFGSGASFSRQFEGELSEERLHWHLRRRCFVRRLKSEVLPQLPAKRQVVVPVALNNLAEYRLAEEDVVAWLRSQPLDLKVLDAKIAAALRAERLAQLTALQRLAARGKLAAALAWIHDFLASGEPLVVFCRHREVQQAVMERFPWALHLFGDDPVGARQAAVDAFQRPDGPALIVCATRAAAQGITLTRASNVCFLELEWTPAIHDQAEDRCHRIGQRASVCAWYLLAAETIDETMARLIQRKRQVIDAVTDGRELPDGGLIDGVVRELREGRPFRHLHAVALDTGADAPLAGGAQRRWRKV
ncbi:DEAD/DEAH box helicase [Conexibacter sp. S30A1]|uniref:DEAD/DEAH box helicase n=1 Tax=Conexibacter sp. S30A1 TaxID=2937800 RepID=UPI0020103110|nr:DEAD/DEAH box helicase [Conexibacter sp. S30A1]